MTRNRNGFTIVELTVAVTIIAILATVSVVMYSKIQGDGRNADRASKMSIIANALEKYYKKNGEYPGCLAMTQSGSLVSANVLVGIEPATLLTPTSAAGVTNSITCTSQTAGTGADVFGYVGDGTATCNTGAACIHYTLQYREEGTGNIITIASLH